jgi:hypothetical protein
MESTSRRDAGFTAWFLGFFAGAWFGWAQAGERFGGWLVAATVVSWVVAVIGLVVALRSPAAGSAMRRPGVNRRYGIIVGTEFASAAAGAAILGATGVSAYIPVWVCAVVGVHFFPLAPVLADRGLYILGGATVAVAVAALAVGALSTVDPATVTGIGAGLALLGYSLLALFRAGRRTPDEVTTGSR